MVNPADFGRIDQGSPTWNCVRKWGEAELARLRAAREDENNDLRRLDRLLGRIKQVEALLALPSTISAALKREPVNDDRGFVAPDVDL